jgi:hypothetical protein
MDEWISDDEMDAIGDGLSEIWQAQREQELENQAPGDWLCPCGHYQEDGGHCSDCGKEPPWGCDCGEHEEESDD